MANEFDVRSVLHVHVFVLIHSHEIKQCLPDLDNSKWKLNGLHNYLKSQPMILNFLISTIKTNSAYRNLVNMAVCVFYMYKLIAQ